MKNKTQKLLIGAHMSIEGGLEKALDRAQEIGSTAVQIFTKSNRQWFAKPLNQKEINAFKNYTTNAGLHTIVAHACYLINLASSTAETRKLSINALSEELERCDLLNIPYLVVHPGSHTGQGIEEGIKCIAQGLDEAFEKKETKTMVLLETMAGQGTSVGSKFEELAAIRELSSHKKRIGFCVDTCHIFAAGYDFSQKKSYEELWQSFDKIIGLNHLKLIHLNDSKAQLNARVDRHEELTKGAIGAYGFELLLNDSRFFDVPKILETPKASLQDDARNIATAKQLLTLETKSALSF